MMAKTTAAIVFSQVHIPLLALQLSFGHINDIDTPP